MADIDVRELGPVDYAVFEFPGSRFNGAIAPHITDLVKRGLITILDLVFIKKENDGKVEVLEISDMDQDEIGSLSLFSGDLSDLLSEEDVKAAYDVVAPGSSALFVVWENTWAAPLSTAILQSGGELVSTGRIPVQDLLDTLNTVTPVG